MESTYAWHTNTFRHVSLIATAVSVILSRSRSELPRTEDSLRNSHFSRRSAYNNKYLLSQLLCAQQKADNARLRINPSIKLNISVSVTGPSQVHVQLWRPRSSHRGREDPARGPRRGRGSRFVQRQRARRKRENRRVHGR